jgi:transposase
MIDATRAKPPAQPRGKRRGKTGRGAAGKSVVVGVKQRGGAIKATVTTDATTKSLREVVNACVEKGSFVSTDEWAAYNLL